MVFGHYNADMCTYYNVAVIEFAHGLGSQLKNIKPPHLFFSWFFSYFLPFLLFYHSNAYWTMPCQFSWLRKKEIQINNNKKTREKLILFHCCWLITSYQTKVYHISGKWNNTWPCGRQDRCFINLLRNNEMDTASNHFTNWLFKKLTNKS